MLFSYHQLKHQVSLAVDSANVAKLLGDLRRNSWILNFVRKRKQSFNFFSIAFPDAESLVFVDKLNALKVFKTYKDARMKSFKGHSEALKFAKSGINVAVPAPDPVMSCKYSRLAMRMQESRDSSISADI